MQVPRVDRWPVAYASERTFEEPRGFFGERSLPIPLYETMAF
jgi:hypothetical protein